ncbi:MAG: primosomal protein N' [Oscillospiraceae bacterium]|nr:primosomal protein N' [Oscillospiraceae bacterium]
MFLAEVGVSGTAFAYDAAYTYSVPDGLDVRAGRRVVVPFGRGDRRRMGIVLRTFEGSADGAKEICALIDDGDFLNDEQQKLLIRLKDTAMCTYYEALRALIPPGLGVDIDNTYKLVKRPQKGGCSDRAYRLYMSAEEAEDADEQELILSSDSQGRGELLRLGCVEELTAAKQRIRDKTIAMVRLRDGCSGKKLTKKQSAAAEVLAREGAASVKELCYLAGCTQTVIKKMCADGVCEIYEEEYTERPQDSPGQSVSYIVLSPMQKKAYDGIAALINEKKPSAALLYGVTGSGKTLVFAKLIKHTLEIGRNVIVLIPEISLTPQTVGRFRTLFGETVAVMHSGLSLSQRSAEYKKLRDGVCRIAVGTRSAVFAPLDNVGLVIVDEEGERTYKSESNPRYNAKDIVAQRCLYHGGTMLLASATPSVESWYMAVNGRMHLFELTERYGSAALPDVQIVDTAGLRRDLSDELIHAVRDRLGRGEQSILLLNRRGFHTYVTCTSCRETLTCPNCSIALTYHKKNGRLICHYCGYSEEFTPHCPKCGGNELSLTGVGTQKLEAEIAEFFPDARVLRMDADTTMSRFAYEKQFSAFANGEYDIMVGTQMIAKGLDFPNVTLVGVLNIDRALFAGDFRSYERTFSLITQVVGRSGRSKGGSALIQTAIPDHYIISLAAAQDYKEFYHQESAVRKAMIYPPYCDICVIGFSGLDDEGTGKAARSFGELLEKAAAERLADGKMPLRIYPASRCSVERINGRYRWRIIIKCRNNERFREMIGDVRRSASKLPVMKDISVYADMNGDIP